MEVLVGHWYSYPGNQNDFRIYHDPSDGRFHFIPWGTDGAFMSQHLEQFGVIPQSTYTASELAARLWHIPETRSRYEKRLQKLMNELWDESALNAEVDKIGEITGTPAEQLDIVEQSIDERQDVIESELKGTAPDWPEEPMNVDIVCTDIPSTSGTSALTWSDTHRYTPDGKITLDISIAAQPLLMLNGLVSAAGPIQEIDDSFFRTPRIAFVGTDDTSGREIRVGLYIPESEWLKGEIAFHGYEIFGIVIELLPDGSHIRLGLIGDGTITLEKAGHTTGAAVKGSRDGAVVTVLLSAIFSIPNLGTGQTALHFKFVSRHSREGGNPCYSRRMHWIDSRLRGNDTVKKNPPKLTGPQIYNRNRYKLKCLIL